MERSRTGRARCVHRGRVAAVRFGTDPGGRRCAGHAPEHTFVPAAQRRRTLFAAECEQPLEPGSKGPGRWAPHSGAGGNSEIRHCSAPGPCNAGCAFSPQVWSDDGRLIADWDEPAFHGHTLTGYEVQYRPTGGTQDWVLHVNKGASRTRIVPPVSATTPLTNGQPHEVQVRTVTSAGTDAWSASGLGTPAAPATVAPGLPSVTAIEIRPDSVHIAWEHPATGKPITRYRLQFQTAADPWADHTMPNRSLSTTVTELRSSVTYRFRLRTVNAAGASDWQQFTGTSGVVVPNPPAAPVVRLYDDPEQLTVIWAEPDNGGAVIDRY